MKGLAEGSKRIAPTTSVIMSDFSGSGAEPVVVWGRNAVKSEHAGG